MLALCLVLISVGPGRAARARCRKFCACAWPQDFVVFHIDRDYMWGNILKLRRTSVRPASYVTPAQHSEGIEAWCRAAMLLSVVHVEVQVSDGLSAAVLCG